MNSVVRELIARDGKRKVQIFQRADGSFGFESAYFSEDPFEMCWVRERAFSVCIAASQEIAEREARGRIDWLSDESDDG